MKTRTYLCAGLLALVSLAATAAEPDSRRSINVSGEGEVSVVPDRARLTMGVDALSDDVKTGEAQVNKVVRAYLAAAKSLGTADKDIATTGVNIQPEYQWDEKTRRQVLVGYRVRRTIVVVVRELDRLGDYILRATESGVNQVSPPSLESSQSKELERQALAKAAEDARDNAVRLAQTLGVKLGPVHQLDAQQGYTPPPMPMQAMRMKADFAESGNAEMGIATGEIVYRASVQAQFDLLP